jgi:dGTPase
VNEGSERWTAGGGRLGYDEHATARFAGESVKRARTQERSAFQRDRARVLHSSALRRLAAKTQVVEVGQADFPRTRLTHSLECAQIGRELGASLGCDPDLVDAACLAHDLGHPPFGHNGEFALAQVAAACGGFEGNAQSLRLLTRLEAKVPGAGLNLTRATLDATLKYPWLASQAAAAGQPARAQPIDEPLMGSGHHQRSTDGLLEVPAGAPEPPAGAPEPSAGAKYGCYDEDAGVFAWVREGAPERRPCLEAQVMDWADDVAYSVHDLEDGLHSGLIGLDQLRDPAERGRVATLTESDYCEPGSVTLDELGEVFDGLLGQDFWPQRFDGEPQTVAAVKNLTSELIGRFCDAALTATRRAESTPLSRYAADLVVPRKQRLECALLKGVTAYYVMGRTGAVASQARERQVLTELAAALADGAPGALDPMFRADYESAGSDAARLRVVVDQVASLTDTSATAWHAKLCQ